MQIAQDQIEHHEQVHIPSRPTTTDRNAIILDSQQWRSGVLLFTFICLKAFLNQDVYSNSLGCIPGLRDPFSISSPLQVLRGRCFEDRKRSKCYENSVVYYEPYEQVEVRHFSIDSVHTPMSNHKPKRIAGTRRHPHPQSIAADLQRAKRYLRSATWAVCLIVFTLPAMAQDLDPRAYVRLPVDMSLIVAGFNYAYGGVVLDPTSPIQDLEATVESPMLGAGRTFSLFGLTSQAFVALPYSWAQASGKLYGDDSSITRSGLGDTRIRISTLLFGAPALTREEFAGSSPQTVLGASLTVVAPTGQYYSDKLINLGTHRWAFKPELGLSCAVSREWFIDVYAGVWLFTINRSFYPGTSVRSQNPLLTFQTHVSYNINPVMWAAIDFTYYSGGQSSLNDLYKDDRLNNSRVGATFNFPIAKLSSIKIAYSTGAIIRSGANFSTISAAWQMAFF